MGSSNSKGKKINFTKCKIAFLDQNEKRTFIKAPKTYEELKSQVMSFFPDGDIIISYNHREEGIIPITCQQEYIEAIALNPKTLEIEISIVIAKQPSFQLSPRRKPDSLNNSRIERKPDSLNNSHLYEVNTQSPKTLAFMKSPTKPSSPSLKHDSFFDLPQIYQINHNSSSNIIKLQELEEVEPPDLFGVDTIEGNDLNIFDQYVVRVWEGFLKAVNTRTLAVKRLNHPLYDMNSRASVLSTGDIIITGGSKRPKSVIQVSLSSEKFTKLREMSFPRMNHASVCLNDEIFVIGGKQRVPMKECEVFSDGNWEKIEDLNIGRYGHSATVSGTKIVVCGGVGENSIELYSGNQWILISLKISIPLSKPGLFPINDGNIYIIGGSSGEIKNKMWMMDISKEMIAELDKIEFADTFTCEALKRDDRFLILGVRNGYEYNFRTKSWKIISI
ncbi:unnamed protein product [Blepharisma stoltei]|uniref:Uncharacterized protein n=1 Tax=Blepharisma stoltei TaxID=1481888 RepID=A0AAU9JRE1_9CILI|nr:unnamed protein product [Blepharisma stoltei]